MMLPRFFVVLLFSCFILDAGAQQTGFPDSYRLNIIPTGKDSSFNLQQLGLTTRFANQPLALAYIAQLPSLLAGKGYLLASVDSSWEQDSSMYISLYIGAKYNWLQLTPVDIERAALDNAGFIDKNFRNKPLNMGQVKLIQNRLIAYYAEQGYPFAATYLDSISLDNDQVNALLKVNKGLLYRVDSIRVVGNIKLNRKFLQRYLGITNGDPYNADKLQAVDRRMLELAYVSPTQPSDLTMLGNGSVLNLYLQPKKSSQVNFLVGFLPSANQTGKLQLTGDVNLDLKNLLGSGESILLKWQQLQPKSPRLNLGFDQPYIFNSPFGFNFLFDLFKKDSNFLQVNAQTGVQFDLSQSQSGRLFIQWQNTSLLSGAVDTIQIRALKKLPANIDVKAVNVGLNYDWQKTNFKLNPRSGNELNIISVVGIKNIRPNNDIINLKDPSFNYATLYDSLQLRSYQVRIRLAAAHYFPVGKSATVKTAVNSGWYSSPSIFRNELFQIGGFKLLRGFDEESIYASRYATFTTEYRYLVSLNSYLFSFVDLGLTKNKYQSVNTNNNFIGLGIGIVYETKAGLLNFSLAAGKRDDIKFNLREAAKIHFGYINYF
ncbi:MAG: hypothetical protein JWQ27_1018 [Ferruginibacter sp.]|nr:hypothetical protein [Ferruginibacter sp.]